MISLTKNNELKGYKSLDVYPEVAHFVTTRHEGISTGAYGSFNCSPYTNDSCMNVNRNQSWLFQCMNHQIKELFIPEQSHGCASLIINESFFKESLEMRRLLLRGMDALIAFASRRRIVFLYCCTTKNNTLWLPFMPDGKEL